MGRQIDRADCDERSGLDGTLLALAALSAAGAFWVSILVWKRLHEGEPAIRGSRKILRDLDNAREDLRRQLMAGQTERADETRIRIAELQRMIMQFEGFI
jgi:adenylylsulfate kinase-like enzyme